jgi:circadian clock protein KaiC
VRATLEEFAPVRAVIEGLGDLQHAARGSDRFADYMWSFLNLFRSVGTTTIITSENVDFFGPTTDLARGLSFLMENVILIRYTEVESDIRRAFAVVKMRDSDHERSLVQCEISSRGIGMKGKFAGMAGVLTGIPRSTQEKFGEFIGR